MSEDIELVSNERSQALRFGTYYLGHGPNEMAVDLYTRAIAANPEKISPEDKKLLQFVLVHGWSLGLIDGGLAFFRPHAELRRRLFIMFAVLESIPEYTDYFLPKQRSWAYMGIIFIATVRATIRMVLGAVLIKAIA
jgi:hypothetical protein